MTDIEYDEDDFLMLSGIQHFSFCKRQWALIHLEQAWEENSRTASGKVFHEKVDTTTSEKRGDLIILRGARVSSSILGLSGRCDVIEIHATSDGQPISGFEGKFEVNPVEYKIGHRKICNCDRIQLCAEAIALEESFHISIYEGFLFYGQERRREKIVFNNELRAETKDMSRQMHEMFSSGALPEAVLTPVCRKCSLFELCQPEIDGTKDVEEYIESEVSTI